MDGILRGSKLVGISAIDGDVGAGVVKDSIETEREGTDVPIAASKYIKVYIFIVFSMPISIVKNFLPRRI